MAVSVPLPAIVETIEELEIIKIGEEALDRVTKTFDHWMEVARALEAGYQACLRATGHPIIENVERGEEGGQFNRAYSHWLTLHPKLQQLGTTAKSSKTIRSWLHKCLISEGEILAWRIQMGWTERRRFNYPQTVWQRWARATGRIEGAGLGPGRKKKEKDNEKKNLDQAVAAFRDYKLKVGDWDHDRAQTLHDSLQDNYPRTFDEVVEIAIVERGDTVNQGIGAIDWEADEESIRTTLLAILPQTEKVARILRDVTNLHRRMLRQLGAEKPKRKPKNASPDTPATKDQSGSGGVE